MTEQTFVRSISPQNKQVLKELPCATKEDVDGAITAALAAFQSNPLNLRARLKKIKQLRKIIASRADEIATLISKEVGKPLAECYASEITGVLDTCVWLAKNAEKLLATQRVKLGNPLARSKKCYISYEAMGVVGIISPWNFPFSIPMGAVLNAVVAGNSVVLKPSEKSSLTGLLIKELFDAAGFPEGTVNVIVGDGMTGKHLSESPHLSRLILTGSVRAGQRIVAQTAQNLTPVTLELGGKDAAIVLPDAPVDFTANGLVWGAFFNAGQACASIERVYVVRGTNTDALLSAIVEKTKRLKVGPPEKRDTDVGPLIDQNQLDTVMSHIAEAKELGATVLTGGNAFGNADGFFHEPTVLGNVTHKMKVMVEETFGPVLPVMIVDTVEEAVRLANDSKFGLTASIWSYDVAAAERLAAQLQAGTVYVNECIFSHAAPELPWGGVKLSGIGRSHSHFGLLDMVNVKNTNVDKAKGKGRLWWYPNRTRIMRGGLQLLHGSFPFGRMKGLFNFAMGWMFNK